MNIDDCINLDDLRKLAKRRLPKVIYDFLEGGCDDENGLDRNEDAFRRRPLMPRYMVDVVERDQTTTLFGQEYSAPFGIAPTGGIANYRWGGDLMLAAAAREANIPFVMSGAATASMEDLARVAPDHGWYQLYVAKDKAISHDMIRRAADLGLRALVVTCDVPVGGNRERNRRNGFGRPLKLSFASKLDALRRPLWFKDYLRHGISNLPNWAPYTTAGASAEDVATFVAQQTRASLTWEDIARFRELWPRHLVIKGIMRTDDALRAADAGVDGIIVSNHGARQLDRAPASIDVLPAIVDAVGDRMTVMLDSGIRRGSDVITALALGARFVFLGRSTLYGAVAGGQVGAAKAVSILRNEVDLVMGQIGISTLDQLGPDFVEWDPEALRRNHPR
ncbi:MAG: alpha-hydroxy-acid oxidizing protein [Ectothiorhodospiraceae bacterium]|nr:alpha-hydroxy-acid oxidizing protein [Chromatiales bacterium]MCP5154904.1 alpha-hydroxy-acid oxidizing protein [Ectothiorhodospiraceae bacterium]